MQKMYIELDEDKVNKSGRRTVPYVWAWLDKVFKEKGGNAIKEETEKGAWYCSNSQAQNNIEKFCMIYLKLKQTNEFMSYVKVWNWYNNDLTGSEEFECEDCITAILE